MLRWMTPFLVAILRGRNRCGRREPRSRQGRRWPHGSGRQPGRPPATDNPGSRPSLRTARPPRSPPTAQPPAKRADKAAARRHAAVRAASQLPPGLPRAHYNYRTTVAPPAAPLYVRPRPHVGGRRRGRCRADRHRGLCAAHLRHAAACRDRRHCPATTGPVIPTVMTAPITAAPTSRTGTVCRMLAACTDTAKRALANNGDGRPTWQGHRGKPARRALPTRSRRTWSPSSSPSPTANPRS